MTVQLHSPLLGIVTILFLIVAYCVHIRTVAKYESIIDIIGYTLLFGFGICGVFIGGVLPFM